MNHLALDRRVAPPSRARLAQPRAPPCAAPQVILGQGYDTASDVWSAACVVFEAAVGDVLFNPRAGKRWSRDEDHLALMIELLGRMPRKLSASGTHAKDFFNKTGEPPRRLAAPRAAAR